MARCLIAIAIAAVALAACSSTPPPKPEPPEQRVPAMSPPELGVKPICDNGYLVGIYIATSEAGMWKLSFDKDVCDAWI
jgi:hypothetical protein